MAKLLKLISCEKCKHDIDESKNYRAYQYAGKLYCKECYEEIIANDNRLREESSKSE